MGGGGRCGTGAGRISWRDLSDEEGQDATERSGGLSYQGAQGIGRAIALRFADEGAQVAVALGSLMKNEAG